MASGLYTDQFKGTAYYYDRYRPRWPQAVLDRVAYEFGLDGSGRLLDLGCGTGQISIPMAGLFEEVIAMDPEPEMLAEAELAAATAGVTNMRCFRGSSADLAALRGKLVCFRLVAMGNSFHWMDRDATLETLSSMVVPGGGVAVLGTTTGGSFWTSDIPWCRVIKATIQRWLGSERRAGSGTYSSPPERHEAIIDRSAFGPCRRTLLPDRRDWTVDGIIGCLYSTSFCSPGLFGEHLEAFEADLRAALLAFEPSGRYAEYVEYEILTGKLPG